jgi:hypothetical protein
MLNPNHSVRWLVDFGAVRLDRRVGQKRLTHVYVRDITEIQFTSNLDGNREDEPNVNAKPKI